MALSDRYTKPDTRTQFEKWLDSLNDTNRAIVDRWLRDETLSATRIVEMIADDEPDDDFTGYRAHKDTILKWRRTNGAR